MPLIRDLTAVGMYFGTIFTAFYCLGSDEYKFTATTSNPVYSVNKMLLWRRFSMDPGINIHGFREMNVKIYLPSDPSNIKQPDPIEVRI